jgi:glycosyltransferase involved in cell wall biosynthesis
MQRVGYAEAARVDLARDPMTPPSLVSVITPSYNMARFLPETVESVLAQDYPHIEYLLVDGGSTDGTVEILEEYRGRIHYTSEPDNGPADAIDRGFSGAKGTVLAWLGADDIYEPGAIRQAVEYLDANPEVDVVYGDGWWIAEDGRPIKPYPTMPFHADQLRRDCFICQPATFFRASSYRSCRLDRDLRLSFDYDLWIRMAAKGYRFAYLNRHLANTRMHKDSLTLGARKKMFEASMGLLQRHYGYVPFSWVFGYTAFRLDGRDQFFEPLRPSLLKYLLSLPIGLWWNFRRPFRFLKGWMVAPWKAPRKPQTPGMLP